MIFMVVQSGGTLIIGELFELFLNFCVTKHDNSVTTTCFQMHQHYVVLVPLSLISTVSPQTISDVYCDQMLNDLLLWFE